MLVKVKPSKFSVIIEDNSAYQGVFGASEGTIIEYTASAPGQFNFISYATIFTSSGQNGAVILYKNGTVAYTHNQSGPVADAKIELNLSVNSGDVIKVTARGYNNSYKLTLKSLYADILYMEGLKVGVGGFSDTVVNIGGFLVVNIYGNNGVGTYKGGIMLSKETTATTGEITLGNAVGYISVNFNGEIVKIPYYNE